MKIPGVRVRMPCSLGLGAFVAAPLTAAASAPEPLRIETHGAFTGPDSTAGTFTITGAVSDSGTYADTFRLAGQTLHVVKTLSGWVDHSYGPGGRALDVADDGDLFRWPLAGRGRERRVRRSQGRRLPWRLRHGELRQRSRRCRTRRFAQLW